MSYIVAHDLGTSRHKAILTTGTGEIVATAELPLSIRHPAEGWAEQSPEAWWQTVAQATRMLLRDANVPAAQVSAIAFACQTQATVAVDRHGRPVCDALIWMDARAKAESRNIVRGWPKVQGYGLWRMLQWLHLTNGVPTHSGRDTIAKIAWLKTHAPTLWQNVRKVLDAKDYLLWRCTNNYVTSYDCGHLTWLMDVRPHRLCWSPTLLRLAGLQADLLPTLMPSTASAGGLLPQAAKDLGLLPQTPVIVGATDVTSLSVGTGALAMGEASVGLGTSAWVSAHVPTHRVSVGTYTASITSALPDRPLVVAHQELGGGCATWFLRMARARLGTAEPTAADYTWLQEAVQQVPPGADGLLFLPWLAGEYAPIQDSQVRGAFFGLNLQHQAAHLGRAVLEGVAHNVRWALQAVEALTHVRTPHLRIAGGGAQSDAWCQILADVCQRDVYRPSASAFTTALGAARLASLHLGNYASIEALRVCAIAHPAQHFVPDACVAGAYDAGFAAFKKFYHQTRGLRSHQAPALQSAHDQLPVTHASSA